MVKTTIKEVTEKFDKNGTLIERLTREEFVEDDESCGVVNITSPTTTTPAIPYTPATPIKPWYAEPYCNNNCYKDVTALQELDDAIALKSISGVNDNCTLNGIITANVPNIQPLNSINDVINTTSEKVTIEYSDNSTENAFKKAVSRCIR